MEPGFLAIALGPLAIYLIWLGAINLFRRPRMLSGVAESTALAAGLAGFVAAGPMRLFLPEEAASRFGGWAWCLLATFYVLCALFWILASPPRLVIYNVHRGELLPILSRVATELDPLATWAGDTLALPNLGVQLTVTPFSSMRNVSLVAAGDAQSLRGWRRLAAALRPALALCEVSPNPRGVSFLVAGLVMVVVIVYKGIENPQALAKGLIDMFEF